MGSDLYNNLIKYFVNHLKTLRTVCFPYATPMSRTVYLSASPSHQASDALQDEALLRYYAQEWDRYTTGANYINRLFTYLNRHWVKREKDEGRRGVYQVYTLALHQWKTQLFEPIQNKGSKLANAVLKLIDKTDEQQQ